MEQLQSNIQYYLLIYEEIFPHFLIYSIGKPFLIHTVYATAPL